MADTVEHDQSSVLDPGGDARQAFRRCRDVLGTGDRQYRRGDFAKPVGDVEVRERLARLGVGLVVGVAQRVEQCGGDVGSAVDESGGEPALRGEFDHRVGARCPHRRGTRGPILRSADDGAGAQQRGGQHPLGCVQQ